MLEEHHNKESLPLIQWVNYENLNIIRKEVGEVERVVETVLGISRDDSFFEITKMAILEKIFYSSLQELSQEIWEQLENTDSNTEISKGDFQKAKEYAEYYKKNYDGLVAAIKKGEKLPAPVILHWDERYHLISGNTRLMIAKASGQIPQIIVVDYDS